MSFSLKVITVLQWGPWNFLVITNRPLSPSPTPCSASRRRPPTAPTAPTPAPWRGFPAAFFRHTVAHASRGTSSTALWLRAGPLQPVPRAQNLLAAATATPPWRARRRAPALVLARAWALQIAPQTIPFVCFPIPQPQTQEHHRRRPPNAGELDAAVGPPLCGSSARADHTSSFALVPRSSTTPPTRSIPTGTAPPPTRAPTSSKLATEPPR